MNIDSSQILAGLGSADRTTVACLLALYSDAALHKLVADQATDLRRRLRSAVGPSASDEKLGKAFSVRVEETSREICNSRDDTERLRLRVWMHLRHALGLPAALTFSKRGAGELTSDIAIRVSELHAAQLYDEKVREISTFSHEYWREHANRRLNPFADKRLQPFAFEEAVRQVALRTLAGAADRGDLAPDLKAELVERIRSAVESLDGDARGRLFESAGIDEFTDAAALKILLGAGGLAGTGIAVEVSGFAAYILAAKASAIIPLVGGKTLVSTLAVISNPLFIIPVILGGGLYLSHSTKRHVSELFSVPVACVLTLQAAANGIKEVEPMLRIFRSLPAHLPKPFHAQHANSNRRSVQGESVVGRGCDLAKRAAQRLRGAALPEDFPDALGYLARFEELRVVCGYDRDRLPRLIRMNGVRAALEKPVHEEEAIEFSEFLFDNKAERRETAALGALTFGDLLYDLAAIDPKVIDAVDFSRVEEIGDRLSFAVFADRVRELSGETLEGTHLHLRGYVAEQVVAVRLVEQGHQVSPPDTPNQPGYDLVVDGQPFQVKCAASIGVLDEHFEKYPEIPVLANSELVSEILERDLEWIDRVFVVEGYTLQEVDTLLDNSLEAGVEALEYEVPLFSAIVLGARSLSSWWRGNLGLRDAAADLAAGVAAKSGLGVAGALTGKSLGLLIFGPAGAVVFGGVLAVLAASQSGRRLLRNLVNRNIDQELSQAAAALRDVVVEGLKDKIAILESKRSELGGSNEVLEYLRERFEDEIRYFREREAEAARFDPANGEGVSVALRAVDLARRSKVHVARLQRAYKTLLKALEGAVSARPRW